MILIKFKDKLEINSCTKKEIYDRNIFHYISVIPMIEIIF